MDDMNMLMDLVALVCGFYCMYTWIRLLITKRLFKNGLLVPKDKDIKDCSDEKAYLSYMMPPLAALALSTTVYGTFFLLNDLTDMAILPYPWLFLPLAGVMGIIVWYAVRNGKANRLYFGM